LVIDITYTINDIPVDLSNHAARMDIAPLAGGAAGAAIFAFNSEDVSTPLDETGEDDNEVTLNSEGNIHIKISRLLTLPGMPVGDGLLTGTTEYAYDLFLRDKALNVQKKLLTGKITVVRSVTQWQ
jgi:hypothetical protein